MRFALRLEFDGRNFCGWQAQSAKIERKHPSIQRTIQRAFKKLLATRKDIKVSGCGRTDSGVHAEEYVAHVDIPSPTFAKFKNEARRLRLGLNSLLPPSICVKDLVIVDESFDALDSVVTKVYEYRVLVKMTKPVLDLGRVYWIPAELSQKERFDLDLLKETIKILEGTKDFAAFASSGHSVKSTVRKIIRVSCEDEIREGARGRLVRIQFEGGGFLKQQVRNMVGASLAVATHKRPRDFVAKLLEQSKGPSTRIPSLFCAPAEGLFLVKVNYDRPIFPQEEEV
ncbi:MAG: tRNA pseudouridine synthase A [Bdellovibrionota bacterium]